MSKIKILACLIVVLLTTACATVPPNGPPPATQNDINALAQEIRALGPEVDAQEAERAARIAFNYSRHLAVEYGVTDPPVIHNIKVNYGLRPRGLCYHWADDIEARLAEEQFQTLELHRAIANHDTPLRLQHSTTIVSRRGDDMFQGIVIDPWRNSGLLHWSPVLEDPKYVWHRRQDVFREQYLRRGASEPAPSS